MYDKTLISAQTASYHVTLVLKLKCHQKKIKTEKLASITPLRPLPSVLIYHLQSGFESQIYYLFYHGAEDSGNADGEFKKSSSVLREDSRRLN